MAVLFMIGSTAFVLGPFPPYDDAVSSSTVAMTYFVGSLFFTSAGYLQFVQTINAAPEGDRPRRHRLLAWQPHRIDWWSAGVQSLGTLAFNRSTYNAMNTALSTQQEERLVWGPDLIGSVAFLVASSLAWIEVCDGSWGWHPRETPWRIVSLNLVGSIAFLVSAVAAYIDPSTGEVLSLPLANLGTFVGAVCFFLGALLLIPELSDR